MFTNQNDLRDLYIQVQSQMRQIRRETPVSSTNFNKPVHIEERTAVYAGNSSKRLVIFLRGTGCYHATKTGGCTFCGFFSATNLGNQLPSLSFVQQVEYALDLYKDKIHTYSNICIYNDGSMLQEKEIPLYSVERIFEILSKLPYLKKITIESKLSDITETKIKKLSEYTDRKIEISIGFESANPFIRKYCINKYFSDVQFNQKYKILQKYNVDLLTLIILKPPFLNERESIYDTLISLRYLENYQISRIDFELPTIEKNTLSHLLWTKNLYKPIKFWSVIEILKQKQRFGFKKPLYISPSNYTVPSIDISSNCINCNSRILTLFEKYNQTNDARIFDFIQCSCKNQWIEDINRQSVQLESLPKRIQEQLNLINNPSTFKVSNLD